MDFSVDKIAALAYLKLSPEEKGAFQTQFQHILSYVDQLREIPASSEEMSKMGSYHILSEFYRRMNLKMETCLRDEDHPSEIEKLILTNEEALKNAPKSGGIPGELLFEVPSIIERKS